MIKDYRAYGAKILSRVFGPEAVEYSETSGVIRVFVDNDDDREIATELAHLLYLELPNDEVASDGILRFVEIAGDTDSEDEEDMDDEDMSDDDSSEDEPESDSDEEEDEGSEDDDEDVVEDGKEQLNAIDSDGRSLKILTTPDMHKFAAKVYSQILGNDDLSRYPAFMMDLDKFFSVYKSTKKKSHGDDIDTASVLFDAISEIAMVEVAKKEKSGRAAFLSAFMAALSSEVGIKAVAAFEAQDVDGFATAMGDLVTKLLDNFPEPEEESDTSEDTTDDGGSGEEETTQG